MESSVQLLILGCGASLGVPVLGCSCDVCRSQKPLNNRRRSSVLINSGGKKILVDFGADIRQQLLENNINNIDAAILTHMHADHVAGIDDLRVFPFFSGRQLPIFTSGVTALQLKQHYEYLFRTESMRIEEVELGVDVSIAGVDVVFSQQQHGKITSLGMKVGDVMYCNDVSSFSEDGLMFLKHTPNWIIDCMGFNATDAHIGLEEVRALAIMHNPKAVYLTNMSHEFDYYDLCHSLPQNIKPLYDGMKLNF